MLVDLHNHTPLCNHASGTPKEYIKKAIELGCKYYGFADHNPMNFDEKYRMSFEQMSEYEQNILACKEEFKDDIEVLLGYEVDFFTNLIDERVLKRNVDFLIGSVHFLGTWGFDNPEFIGEYKNKDIDKIWEDYFLAIEKMAKSKLFDIVGHFDLMKIFNFLPKKDIRILAKNAIKSIKKANMVVELNTAGLRKPINEIYPSPLLLELIANENIPITFSSDAHNVLHVGFGSEEVCSLAKYFGYSEIAIFNNRDRKLIKF